MPRPLPTYPAPPSCICCRWRCGETLSRLACAYRTVYCFTMDRAFKNATRIPSATRDGLLIEFLFRSFGAGPVTLTHQSNQNAFDWQGVLSREASLTDRAASDRKR